MKAWLRAAAFLILGGASASAETIAVLAKNTIVVGTAQLSGAIPEDPAARGFLDQFRDAARADSGFPAQLPLVNPPDWGKTISANTGGRLRYHPRFAGGLVCHLALQGLRPHQTYILTLNGRPDLPGNEALPLIVPGMETERYYDFLFIQADEQGSYEATLGIALAPASYEVRMYVKDTSDFRIVLYRDYFPFTVE